MTRRWPRLRLPAPCCQGENICPKKEHILFFFFSIFLFISQARSRGGNKGKKRHQLLIRSAAVVLSPGFSMPVDVVSFVLGVLF